ncbi:MAG: helix-hairpin-helix domain-containing protein [Rubripirellula sp.]|jgi:competence protein ComEA|nr:helix-hairpin-helix domain-containing protein [Rubripirellula sp.]
MDRRSRGRGLIDININLANEHELTLLPNVGPVLAKRIVEYRSQNGHFQTLADLMSVPGVGPKTVEIIQGIAILQP